jgi:hypothetical protein
VFCFLLAKGLSREKSIIAMTNDILVTSLKGGNKQKFNTRSI